MKYEGIESSKLELKRTLPKSSQIIKTAVAFANTHGGKLVIGVSDDGQLEGIPEDEVHEAMEWLDKAIYEAVAPPIIPLIYQQRVNNRVLIIIEIAMGTNKPYYQKSLELTKGVFVRLGRSTVHANVDMIEELKWQSRGLSYDQLPVYHTDKKSLDMDKVGEFLDHRRNGAKAKLTEDVLTAYQLMSREHNTLYATVAGLLLFSQDPQKELTEAYVLCSHFSGVEGRNALASRAIKGDLFEQFDSAYDFIIERLNKSFQIKGKKRLEVLEVPPEAIREVLMNAILHRNYHIKASIKVAIYQDRIEITSPGTFPGPVDLANLESGITYVRNTALAKVLWESGYIEKMGSGLIELFRSYHQHGLRAPIVKEGVNFVKCILPREAAILSHPSDEELILSLFQKSDKIARGDIVNRLSIPKSTVGRLLTELVQQKKLVRIGEGRGTRYHLP